MKDKKSKIQLIIIILELIILIGVSGYRIYEYMTSDKEEVKENENNSNIEDEKDNISNEDKTKEEIRILVYQINIRKEANENSEDIGDVLLDETYDVLEVIDSANYTWYKIKQGNIIGYVANQKGENWVEYSGNNLESNNKILYFYEQDGNLYVVETNNNKNYVGKYECKNDICFIHDRYGEQLYDLNNNITAIFDSKWFLYDYQEQKIISDYYDDFDVKGDYISAKKESKYVLLSYSGKELSKYYDFIGNYGYTPNVIQYQNNNRHGLLSLKDGNEIIEEEYEELTIFLDNIVVTANGLQYVMDEKGNIVSQGYESIMWSNNEFIAIFENNMIDIIDYSGNSKINEKIEARGYTFNRREKGEGGIAPQIFIDYLNNNLKISVPDENYNLVKYIYNTKTETLTIEKS